MGRVSPQHGPKLSVGTDKEVMIQKTKTVAEDTLTHRFTEMKRKSSATEVTDVAYRTVFDSGQRQGFFSSPSRSDRLWVPPSPSLHKC